MNGGLAIFVKTPGRSPIKTRLAASHGRAFAEHWHRLAAAAVASVVQTFAAEDGWQAYWAVAEPEALSEWSGFPCLYQGEGGLGERMACVHQALLERHGRAILIGADSPQLTSAHLRAAAKALGSDQAHALGPAEDGGFWLLASAQPIDPAIWLGVPYSQSDTGQRMADALRESGARCRLLDTLRDLDRASDLDEIGQALQALRQPTAAQRALAAFLATAGKDAGHAR